MFINTECTDIDYAQNMILLNQLYEFSLDDNNANDTALQERYPQNENIRLAHDNLELTLKLQAAETKIESLKSISERLGNGILTLSEKLENANNEIARLDMLMKRQCKDVDTLSRLGKNTKMYSPD